MSFEETEPHRFHAVVACFACIGNNAFGGSLARQKACFSRAERRGEDGTQLKCDYLTSHVLLFFSTDLHKIGVGIVEFFEGKEREFLK